MAQVQGGCEERFGAVRDALAESLDRDDVGASAAVYLNGEPVADLWGGYADEARTIPWGRDTITNVWSTTKVMTALCALILADRGDLDLAAPVARYWPEFAAAGKDGVLVRHLLAHTAGLPTWDEPMTVEDLYDWPTCTARLAAQSATVGAGHRGRLPRADLRISGWRGDPPGHRPSDGGVLRRRGGRAAGRRFPHRAAGRARPPGRARDRAPVLARGEPVHWRAGQRAAQPRPAAG
jgi:CubicO group peptidase (beta-lactamase class C family)